MKALIDPIIIFFLLGLIAGLVKSGLRIPKDFYDTISIYLLLSIGIKGGVELYESNLNDLLYPALGTIFLGGLVTIVAYLVLKSIGKFNRANAAAIATHYGSVSAVTFAVVLSFLQTKSVAYEKYSTVLLVLLEIPAIVVGIFIAKFSRKASNVDHKKWLHEVFLGKTVILLVGGIVIGIVTEYSHNGPVKFFFFDLFRGFLAIFMLEMGILTSQRMTDLKKVGTFLLIFGIAMPVISASMGILIGMLVGLSVGGTVVLATMAASASYIAAPAAIGIAIPEANPTYYLTMALGITFPFNVIIGIPLYHRLADFAYHLTGIV
jgi:hypothetical protein